MTTARQHRSVRRVVAAAALVTVALGAAACGGGDDDEGTSTPSTLANGTKFVKGDACTLLSEEQVGEVFGTPVSVDATNSGSPLTTDCAYTVGDPAAPVGTLVANIVWPSIAAGEGSDPLSVVESDRANAQLAGPGVFDLGLAQAGFLESARSVAEFVVRPNLAVSLQWQPAGGPPTGSPVTDEVRLQLAALASDITTRLG